MIVGMVWPLTPYLLSSPVTSSQLPPLFHHHHHPRSINNKLLAAPHAQVRLFLTSELLHMYLPLTLSGASRFPHVLDLWLLTPSSRLITIQILCRDALESSFKEIRSFLLGLPTEPTVSLCSFSDTIALIPCGMSAPWSTIQTRWQESCFIHLELTSFLTVLITGSVLNNLHE